MLFVELLFFFNVLDMFLYLSSILFIFSFVLFYLDGFKLSSNVYLKTLQLFSFGFVVCICFNTIYCINLDVLCVDDKSPTVGVNVEISKDSVHEIGRIASTVGAQAGLGASIAGVGAAVSKSIASSSIPPFRKVGVILGASAMGGVIHVAAAAVNRKNVYYNKKTDVNTDSVFDVYDNSPISKEGSVNNFMSDINGGNSPIIDLLYSLEVLNSVCLFLVCLLFVQIVFKILTNENIKLDFSKYIGCSLNKSLNFYLVKLVLINKKVGNIYIWIILLLLFIGLYSSVFFTAELYTNLDDYVNMYNCSKKG